MRENDNNKFKELAEKRVNSAIKTMRLIGNLSNKRNYTYEKSDVKKIYDALKHELESIKSRFEQSHRDSEDTFKL